jgi:hypothetical protein
MPGRLNLVSGQLAWVDAVTGELVAQQPPRLSARFLFTTQARAVQIGDSGGQLGTERQALERLLPASRMSVSAILSSVAARVSASLQTAART